MQRIPRQQRLCCLQKCLFLHGFPATHAVDHFFIDRQHVGLFADFRQLFHRDPLYRSVFVRLDPQRFFLVGNDAVGDVIVLMCRNGNALFLMCFDRENVQRENGSGKGIGFLNTGFLFCLPHGCPEKITGTVSVSACPCKGIVDAVVDHQHLIHCRIHDETGTGEMAFRVAAVEQLCAVLFRRKEYLVPVAAFLFGFGRIGSKTFFPVGHILFLHDVSHVVCPFFLITPHKPCAGLSLLCRQQNRNFRTVSQFAAERNGAVVTVHDMLDDRQPQSCAATLFRTAFVHPIEPFKDPALCL